MSSENILYKVNSTSHALRQAASLARVLAYPLICQDIAFTCISPMLETGLSLLDTWLDLRQVQKRWEPLIRSSVVPLIETAVEVIKVVEENSDSGHTIYNKVSTTLILLSSELMTNTDDLTKIGDDGDNVRIIFSTALVYISKASLASYSTCRLAASKIARELAVMSLQTDVLVEGSDLWRCALLLNHITDTSPAPMDEATLHHSQIQNDELRQAVEQLGLELASPNTSNGSKRRKFDGDNNAITELQQMIYYVLDMEAEANSALEESVIL